MSSSREFFGEFNPHSKHKLPMGSWAWLSVGIVACLQTHGSRANWHPHLHLLVTDGSA